MTKKQKIKALEALKKEFQKGFCSGLCRASEDLHCAKDISDGAYQFLSTLLIRESINRLGTRLPSAFFWDKYAIAPRTRWINQQIKKLKGE
ncbi:MAG: hypothetical protein IPJ03_15900 [Ignavibacteriales bacterium]|nr:hypothetical protein [Ignavibacteriales bacterium]